MISIGLLFWLIMIITLVFGAWRYRGDPAFTWVWNDFPWYVLFFLLGWAVFGWPIGGK